MHCACFVRFHCQLNIRVWFGNTTSCCSSLLSFRQELQLLLWWLQGGTSTGRRNCFLCIAPKGNSSGMFCHFTCTDRSSACNGAQFLWTWWQPFSQSINTLLHKKPKVLCQVQNICHWTLSWANWIWSTAAEAMNFNVICPFSLQSLCSLCYDRSIAISEASSPHSAS
jgi:hypothetical protein